MHTYITRNQQLTPEHTSRGTYLVIGSDIESRGSRPRSIEVSEGTLSLAPGLFLFFTTRWCRGCALSALYKERDAPPTLSFSVRSDPTFVFKGRMS